MQMSWTAELFTTVLLAFAVASPAGATLVDFETDADGNPLSAGDIIDGEYLAHGITITTNDPTNHPAMIFDSANPTGGDSDLGAPNQDFGGPGVGTGGAAGNLGQNDATPGNILIISASRRWSSTSPARVGS